MISAMEIAWHVEDLLSKGREETKDGWFIFSRKELAEITGFSPQTIYRNINETMRYLESRSFGTAKYYDIEPSEIYMMMKWEKGSLMFKRNPLTYDPKYKYLFGKPNEDCYWTYESFDEKHRRRGPSPLEGMRFNHWISEEEIEKKIKDWKEKGVKIWACPYFAEQE